MPSAVAGFLIWAARRLKGWDSYERPVAADLKTSEQALARGADAHGSGGQGLSIREITCLFAQNQQSCLLYRNNVDDATPLPDNTVKGLICRAATVSKRLSALYGCAGRGLAGRGGGSGSDIGAIGAGRDCDIGGAFPSCWARVRMTSN